jgi:hypothetical protein
VELTILLTVLLLLFGGGGFYIYRGGWWGSAEGKRSAGPVGQSIGCYLGGGANYRFCSLAFNSYFALMVKLSESLQAAAGLLCRPKHQAFPESKPQWPASIAPVIVGIAFRSSTGF